MADTGQCSALGSGQPVGSMLEAVHEYYSTFQVVHQCFQMQSTVPCWLLHRMMPALSTGASICRQPAPCHLWVTACTHRLRMLGGVCSEDSLLLLLPLKAAAHRSAAWSCLRCRVMMRLATCSSA